MALTVANVWNDVKSRVKNIGGVSATQQLRLASIVNREIRDVYINEDPEKFISSSSITVVSGTSTYSLPADFQTIDTEGCGVYVVDDNGDDTDIRLPVTGFGSNQRGFYIDSSNIALTPEPNASDTLKLRYIPTVSDFAADSETFVVDERFRELVRAGVLTQYYWQKGESHDAEYVNWSTEYSSRLVEFARNVRRGPGIVSLKDFSGAY